MAYRLNIQQQYNRALQIAYFLCEGGHTIKDVCDEFRICKSTCQSDLKLLASYGFGDELKRNQLLYIKAKTALYNAARQRQGRRG